MIMPENYSLNSLEFLINFLLTHFPGKVVIMGVGNQFWGDDRAGLEFITKLKHKWHSTQSFAPVLEGERVLISAGEFPEDWLIRILDFKPEFVILIDAVDVQAEPGSIAILRREDLPDSACFSTHRLPLRSMVNLWEKNGSKVLILAIQPERIDFGERVSSSVERSINHLIELIPPLSNFKSIFFEFNPLLGKKECGI